MFDLDAAITDWRMQLANRSMATEQIDELDTHLRDAVDSLTEQGFASPEEAFWLARRRLGEPQELVPEYHKVDGALVAKRRMLWMMLGFLAGGAVATALGGLAATGVSLAAAGGWSGSVSGLISVLVLGAGWLVIFMWGTRMLEPGRWPAWNARSGWAIAAGLLLITLMGQALSFANSLWLPRMMTAETYGHSLMWTTLGAQVIRVNLLLAVVIAVGVLSGALRGSSRPTSTAS